MSPEAVVGLLHLADRFNVMVLHLLRQPLPTPPELPGRRIVAPPISTPAEDAAHIEAEQQAAEAWRALAEGEGSGDHD